MTDEERENVRAALPQGFLGNNPMAQFAGWGGGGLANAFRGAAPQAPQSMFGMGRSY